MILRRNALALARLREAADHDDDLFMCPVVFYELWRGLSYRGADRPLEELNAVAGTLQWVDYDPAMWVEAAGTSRTSMSRSLTGPPISQAVEVPSASYGTGRAPQPMATIASPRIHDYALCDSIPAHFRTRCCAANVPEIRRRESIS